jgi:hypothetical protein
MLHTVFWLKAGHADEAANYTLSHATKDNLLTLCGRKVGRMAYDDVLENGLTCQHCQDRLSSK